LNQEESEPFGATSYHVARARSGDSESLGWLVERFTPLLIANARYRMGKTLRRLYDPEDIVSDVWVVTLPRLPDLSPRDGHSTPVLVRFLSSTLIFRINNLIDKHIRGKPRQIGEGLHVDDSRSGSIGSLADDATGIVTRAVRAEIHRAALDALDRLEERDRVVIILRGVEGQAYKDIGTRLGEDPKILAVRYQRAIAKLRDELPRGVFDELANE
jgi:RNA polymerase sigma factor (sigma-70 family)